MKIVSPLNKKLLGHFSPGNCNVSKHVYRKRSDSSSGDHGDRKDVKWPTGNRISFNFHPETEATFNQQANAEFKAFYYYLSMVLLIAI